MTIFEDELTEFLWIDPDSVHLVKNPANGVAAPLLAKAAEALDEELCYSGDGLVKFVDAKTRHKYAKSGVAMSTGGFPIADRKHLDYAIGFLSHYKGDKAAAKAHIIKRARALNLVHLLPKEWHVTKEVDHAESEDQTHEVDEVQGTDPAPSASDGGEPRHVAADDKHVDTSDGEGDTAPDKSLPTDEAEEQTHELPPVEKAEVDMTGDVAPDGQAETRTAEHEAEEETRELPASEASKRAIEIYKEMGMLTAAEAAALIAAKESPFVSARKDTEHEDVELGQKAEALVSQLAEVVATFTEREKAEGGASKGARRILRAVKHLAKNPTLLKEFPPMPTSELLKALDELDAARRAEKKVQKKAEQKAEKREAQKKAAKAAAKAAKATAEPTESPKLAKALARLDTVQKQVDAIAAQDAKRVMVNGAGAAAVLRGSEAPAVLKSMDDRVAEAEARLEKAATDFERTRAKGDLDSALRQRAAAKLVAADNARERGIAPRGRFGPNSAELFKNIGNLADDQALSYR